MTEPPVDPDLLNGWKEIASWSGKSVRSVQRWERDLGLPVHRIKTADGQSVYARRSELDAWRASLDAPNTAALDHENGADPADGLQERDLSPGQSPPGLAGRRSRALIAAAGLIVIAVAAAMSLINAGADADATGFDSAETRVRAFDSSGRVVWEHDRGYPIIWAGTISAIPPIRVDIDGDGEQEVLAALKHADRRANPVQPDALLCLDARGQPCWELRPQHRFTCGSQVFGGPWQISDVAVVEQDGRTKLWVAFVHHTWWPSFVLEVEPDGSNRLVYFQPGWIATIGTWHGPSGSYLVAGGVFNAHQRASLAFVRTAVLPASAPLDGDEYACAGLPPVGAERVLILPSFDVQVSQEPYPFVLNSSQVGSGLKAHYAGSGGGSVVLELDSSLDLGRLSRADAYWTEHRRLEQAGLLDHAASSCPELGNEQKILVWDSRSGWQVTTVTPNGP